jgi:nitrite reductase/ring-hydroxylating ferredoxin subunit
MMKTVTRKDFLKLVKNVLTAFGLGAILTPIVAYFYPAKLEEMPSDPVSAGNLDEIPLGKSKTIRFGRYPAIIVNTQTGLKAYSAVCTHFACITRWDEELEQIVCPCHEGYFDPEDGSVISGPPPSPLEPLVVDIQGETIFISAGGEA